MESENGIKVNFSSAHSTYYSAYEYVTKEDDKFLLSDGHPEQSGPPVTEAATRAKKGKRMASKRKGRKKERYTTFDVVEIIRQNKFKSRLELVGFAIKQKNESKRL